METILATSKDQKQNIDRLLRFFVPSQESPPRDVLYTQKKAYGTQSLGIQNSYSNIAWIMRFLKGFAALFKTKFWIDLEVWRTLI